MTKSYSDSHRVYRNPAVSNPPPSTSSCPTTPLLLSPSRSSSAIPPLAPSIDDNDEDLTQWELCSEDGEDARLERDLPSLSGPGTPSIELAKSLDAFHRYRPSGYSTPVEGDGELERREGLRVALDVLGLASTSPSAGGARDHLLRSSMLSSPSISAGGASSSFSTRTLLPSTTPSSPSNDLFKKELTNETRAWAYRYQDEVNEVTRRSLRHWKKEVEAALEPAVRSSITKALSHRSALRYEQENFAEAYEFGEFYCDQFNLPPPMIKYSGSAPHIIAIVYVGGHSRGISPPCSARLIARRKAYLNMFEYVTSVDTQLLKSWRAAQGFTEDSSRVIRESLEDLVDDMSEEVEDAIDETFKKAKKEMKRELETLTSQFASTLNKI